MISVVRVKVKDGSEWFVTVTDIAVDKAQSVAKDKGIDRTYALVQFVLPEFGKNPDAAVTWAKDHMDHGKINLIMLKQPDPLPKDEVLKSGDWYYDPGV